MDRKLEEGARETVDSSGMAALDGLSRRRAPGGSGRTQRGRDRLDRGLRGEEAESSRGAAVLGKAPGAGQGRATGGVRQPRAPPGPWPSVSGAVQGARALRSLGRERLG